MEGEKSIPVEAFGPYLVYEKLGVGGMATVHRATRRGIAGFERVVALKRLHPHVADDHDAVMSFVREAKLAALLKHPNIAHVYDLGRVGDSYYIAMEYVEGYSVLDILRCAHVTGVPLPIDVVMAILVELFDALEYAHTRVDDISEDPLGIVHRDVSPSNLILTFEGHLKVIDFGIAKAMPEKLDTQSGMIKGKFGYMSPEALDGGVLDARSDIYSAGVVAHELLTARRLFGTSYTYRAAARMHRGDVPPPSVVNKKIPPELDNIVLTALAGDPAKRWHSAGEVRDALHVVAVMRGYRATSDTIADWLANTFGDPSLLFGPTDSEEDPNWCNDTDVDSVYPLHTPHTNDHTPTLR
jgi:serine/threonine protein kinase